MADEQKPLFLQGAMQPQGFGAQMAQNPLAMLGLNMIAGSVEGGPTGFGRGMARGTQAMQQASRAQQANAVQQERIRLAQAASGRAAANHKAAQDQAAKRQELFLQMLTNTPENQRAALQIMGPEAAAKRRYEQLTAKPDQPTYTFKELKDGSLARFSNRGDLDMLREAPQGGMVNDLTGPYKDPKQAFEVESGLRKEFTREVKPFREILHGANTIGSLEPEAIKGNPAAQVSLMFAFMKMVDPGSRVTSGEIATFEDTAGVPARIRNAYNSVVEGTPLPEQTVRQYINEARGLANTAVKGFEDVREDYVGIAQSREINPDRALPQRRVERFRKKRDLRKEADDLIKRYANDPRKVERIRQALAEKLKAL